MRTRNAQRRAERAIRELHNYYAAKAKAAGVQLWTIDREDWGSELSQWKTAIAYSMEGQTECCAIGVGKTPHTAFVAAMKEAKRKAAQ